MLADNRCCPRATRQIAASALVLPQDPSPHRTSQALGLRLQDGWMLMAKQGRCIQERAAGQQGGEIRRASSHTGRRPLPPNPSWKRAVAAGLSSGQRAATFRARLHCMAFNSDFAPASNVHVAPRDARVMSILGQWMVCYPRVKSGIRHQGMVCLLHEINLGARVGNVG
ncbi:hypothetical protein DHEL01_v204990 [Diaporthe helianthi]|uniref:Uncharacterized protein n=1 Tax=Diaporthe helianthi TaxID=158607 RepID=A0A2P5I281_DIAHE|nr:hypothetical protein DHEL01_v204990 [Diaporthe helianthi]